MTFLESRYWRTMISSPHGGTSCDLQTWICDHQIGANIIFPAAAYIAMISEAIRQVTGAQGYTVQRVSILAAMVLHEGRATEIITSLRHYRWTETQLSRGHEFTISSLSHDTWVTHCRGLVKLDEEELSSPVSLVSFPRHVRSQQWYDVLRRCGLNYGPTFARLTDITCSLNQASACAFAPLDQPLSGSSYPVHPTLIDEAFQLLSVADARGHPRAISGTYIPIYIEELCIRPSTPALSLRVDVDLSESIRGSMIGWSNDKIVLSGRGIHMSKLEDPLNDPSTEVQSGARLHYLPLLRFLDPAVLLRGDNDAQSATYKSFLRHFTHKFPQCKILDITGHTISATQDIIENLYSESGERMFASYTFASCEDHVLSTLKANEPAVKFATFDIRRDGTEQDLPLSSYDLVIAHDLVESAQSGQTKLKNIRKLLKPCGYLLAHEDLAALEGDAATTRDMHDPETIKPSRIMNVLRITPEHWDHVLRQAGLSGQSVLQNARDTQSFSLIVAQPIADCSIGRVTLLVPSETSSKVTTVMKVLSENEIRTTLQKFLWLTQSANPRYSLVHGFARNVRFELGLDCATIKIDKVDDSFFEILPFFVRKYRYGLQESESRDYDYVLVNGVIEVGRFHWYSIESALSKPTPSTSGARLTIGKKGLLQSLEWTAHLLEEDLGNNMVAVDVVAVGMNFKDVLVAMGVVSGSTLGIEASGVIMRVGRGVTDLQPGDRVAIAYNGCFATRLAVPRLSWVRLPDSLFFDDAATLYGVYCTSLPSLIRIAKISAGSSVLIHSACGGIGLSAIQLCRSIGAEIYATVGSDRKRRHLQDAFNIPAENIFNSRDSTFRRDLMLRTKDRGVDVVLNSLSGELLHASWECVADFGMMIELGRRDLQEHGRLDMNLNEKLELNQSLMQELSELLRPGKISPVAPLKKFEANDIEDCFRFFQKGEHIGKVAVHMPSSITNLNITRSLRQDTKFDADAAYLLVGGLGGLGRSVSVWMAERGARYLVYLSRSQLSCVQSATLQDSSAMGCTYQIFEGSVTNIVDVEKAVHDSIKPIRGVLQMAADLKDANISDMTYADWQSGISAKVTGTFNLYDSLIKSPLDFFVMFSSHVGLHGRYGQANYAAGNTFQDDFVRYRHSQGLVASVLDIGAVEDIGMTSENPELARRMRSTFRYFLPETELFEALELAILKSRPSALGSQVVAGLRPSTSSADSNSNLPWAHDARFSAYGNMSGKISSSPASSALTDFLVNCSRNPSILTTENACTILSQELLLRICSFLTISEEEQKKMRKGSFQNLALSNLGVDSLVAIEILTWWRQRLGVEVTVLQILDCGNVQRLGELAVSGLKGRFGVADGLTLSS